MYNYEGLAHTSCCIGPSMEIISRTTRPTLSRAELAVCSQPSQLQAIRRFVHNFLSGDACPDLPPDRVTGLVTAVHEAVVNAMRHAYSGHQAGLIQVVLEAAGDRVVARIHDQGLPFDPQSIPEPTLDGSQQNGLGLYIMRTLVDEVEYCLGKHCTNCTCLTVNIDS